MTDETDIEDENRPLTPKERQALRRLISKEPEIIEVANNFSHMGWLATAALKVAKWVTAVVAVIVSWQAWKTGGLIK